MLPLTQQAHQILRDVLNKGDVAIDATAGNGHDTLFLARGVGPSGRVYAFDVQAAALARTRALLAVESLDNVILLQRSHQELSGAIPTVFHGLVAAVTFNLGYLPGGDRQLTTMLESTISGLSQALDVLRVGGVVTIIAYAGHPGGEAELEGVRRLLTSLPGDRFHVTEHSGVGGGGSSPVLFVARRLR